MSDSSIMDNTNSSMLSDNVEVVKKYYLRKKEKICSEGYDWIGNNIFGIYPVELNGHLGFIDNNGKVVIPIIYDLEQHINGTLWLGSSEYFDLRKNGLYGLVKRNGTVVLDFIFEKIDLKKLRENMLPVLLNGKWGFANVLTGKIQIPPSYDEIDFFQSGLAPFYSERRWGFIDKYGNISIPAKYLSISHFNTDFAIVTQDIDLPYGSEQSFTFDVNYKLIHKSGREILSNCSSIDLVGPNTFVITNYVLGYKVAHLKHFIPMDDYIVIIENGIYLSGFVSDEGSLFENLPDKADCTKYTFYSHAKYVGGGTAFAISFDGKPVIISK